MCQAVVRQFGTDVISGTGSEVRIYGQSGWNWVKICLWLYPDFQTHIIKILKVDGVDKYRLYR